MQPVCPLALCCTLHLLAQVGVPVLDGCSCGICMSALGSKASVVQGQEKD